LSRPASEVKALAVQTAKATKQIGEQITTVQSSTARAVESIHRNKERMQDISRHTLAVTTSIEQQTVATEEISHSMSSAAAETKAIDAVLIEVDGSTTETRGSAGSVLVASKSVEAAADELRQQVESFLGKVAIRAAERLFANLSLEHCYCFAAILPQRYTGRAL
jgi:methyl-accepting chemotaxis protein